MSSWFAFWFFIIDGCGPSFFFFLFRLSGMFGQTYAPLDYFPPSQRQTTHAETRRFTKDFSLFWGWKKNIRIYSSSLLQLEPPLALGQVHHNLLTLVVEGFGFGPFMQFRNWSANVAFDFNFKCPNKALMKSPPLPLLSCVLINGC